MVAEYGNLCIIIHKLFARICMFINMIEGLHFVKYKFYFLGFKFLEWFLVGLNWGVPVKYRAKSTL